MDGKKTYDIQQNGKFVLGMTGKIYIPIFKKMPCLLPGIFFMLRFINVNRFN
ncbi:MAG TPA: hypothetical protein PK566_17265 [Pseudobacteroides sp.]|nr:hypothetical protein [Pseudobacteroides sp.]